MSERGPITAELRELLYVDREFMRADGTVVAQTFCVDRGDFERLCDAIDAVHAGLERENAELRQRVAVLDNERGNMHDGGSITDELREYFGKSKGMFTDHVLAIADRIDAEHEEAIQQVLMNEGGVPATDENMAECGWVRLPLDADGVPIRVGDVMDFSKNVRNLTVLGIGTVDGGCSWGVFVREGDEYVWYNAHFLHHHAPTVEDVLREFGRGWHEQMNAPETFDIADYVERYAAKLRLAGDAE